MATAPLRPLGWGNTRGGKAAVATSGPLTRVGGSWVPRRPATIKSIPRAEKRRQRQCASMGAACSDADVSTPLKATTRAQ